MYRVDTAGTRGKLLARSVENTIPVVAHLAQSTPGLQISQEPMSKLRFAMRGACFALRSHWRPFVLGLLIVITAAVCCALYFHGAERGERAALALGGTLLGMLIIGFLVMKR